METGGGYQVVPLADFGRVTFTRATATAGGHTGPITDSEWTAERIDLIASASGYRTPVAAEGSADATASTLAAGGKSFSVSWSQSGATGGGGPGGGGTQSAVQPWVQPHGTASPLCELSGGCQRARSQ